MNWKHKKIVITGGTSGLGLGLAQEFLARDNQVVIVARGEERMSRILKENPGLQGVLADVGDKNQIYPLAGQLHSLLGEIDLLVNAASILGPEKLRLLADTDCEDFEKALQVNLLGPFRLSKALLSSMLLQKEGLIVNISSDAAVNAYENWGVYSVTKAALDHLTRVFDEELKEQGVRVVAVDPGDMATPLHFQAVPDANVESLKKPKQAARQLIELISLPEFQKNLSVRSVL